MVKNINQLFKHVEINGECDEPVNYVGVHPLNWEKRTSMTTPEVGFVELDKDREDIIKKEAVETGNGSHVVLPKDWKGSKVVYIRLEED